MGTPALFESGRPVLVAPPSPRPQLGTSALVAWNCSTEQARTSIHHDSVPDNLKEVWQYEGKKSYYSDRFSGYAIFFPMTMQIAPAAPVAIVSYDEKPGIQAIATTAPDLPPVPGRHASFARDHEYKRHGTLSLLAGIDLLTGKVHALVRERHRSREFIEFLKLLDAAYPASTAIKLILDNHSAHISRETRAWLDTRPPGRFDFTFTPKHGSWLNLIEGFFSKFARSVLRHIRVTSKHELKQRIMAGIDDVNRHPVIHTWSYKLAEAA